MGVNLSQQQKLALESVIEKLLLWIVFNVIIALLPFFSRGMAASLNGKAVNWQGILSDGELFLVAAAIAGGALGDLLLSGSKRRMPKIVVGGGCVVCVMLACFLYAYVRANTGAAGKLTPEGIYLLSRNIFIATFFAGAGCMILSGGRHVGN